MAIEPIESTNTPNEGREIINDNFVDLDGRVNEVEIGVDAFTTTTLSFVQPAISSTVSVTVDNTLWMVVGQPVYMATGGYYTVSSITDPVTVVLTNLGYTGNAAPAVTVASGKKVSPSGIAGATGSFSGPAADVPFTPASGVGATDVQAAIEEVATDVTDHLSDTSDAHDASAISYAGGTGMSATDAEAAIDELATEKANASDLTAHTGDATDAHDASAISFVPAGTIAATDVQAAIEEVATEAGGGGTTLPVVDTTAIVKDATDNTKLVRIEAGSIATGTTRVITMPNADVDLGDTATHIADTSDAHDASAISFSPTGTIAATDVQGAIAEVASEAGGGSGYKTLVTLGSDQTNSTTTLADVTGLSFSVVSGTVYRFYVLLEFTSASTGTGIKLAIAGPAGTLSVRTSAASSAAGDGILHTNTFDATTNTSITSFTNVGSGANIGEMTGFVRPSASGTIQVRFASEVAASAIVIKADSTLEYW